MNPNPLKWLRLNDHNLAALTGADRRALEAIAACWEMLPTCDHPDAVIAAVQALLSCLQPKCHYLARALIARSLDWGDVDRYWPIPEGNAGLGKPLGVPTAQPLGSRYWPEGRAGLAGKQGGR